LTNVLDIGVAHGDPLLFAELDDILRFHRFVSSAVLGIEELQKFLERFRVGRVP
jgi:hypothetical protein